MRGHVIEDFEAASSSTALGAFWWNTSKDFSTNPLLSFATLLAIMWCIRYNNDRYANAWVQMRYWGRNQLSRELRPKVAGEEMVEQFF